MSDEELKAAGLPTHSLVMEETANYAVAEHSEASLLKSLTFAVAMSFHSILEGFALGVQNTTARIVTLFISLILHKGVEAFSVGLQISKGNSNKLKAVIATILIYALMTPLGSGLGTLLQARTSPMRLQTFGKIWAVPISKAFSGCTDAALTASRADARRVGEDGSR
ncbi:hypothetical protein TELCIR_01107 [Teladorsagia circumcincta]|uniref:Metal cation transporter, ZIP family n=1 Tax=Teladorsagia circumcincta TaxID=45464 RepID=A0A2G9V2U0_TELCI|nr:hypothetical protein TELCIR_01107 [Teladorsagia circumcincta]